MALSTMDLLTACLLIAPIPEEGVTRVNTDAAAYGIAFSPDGATVATGDGGWEDSENNGRIRLWESRSGRFKRLVGRHRRGVSALAFAPDGNLIASGGFEGSILLWNLAANNEVIRLPGHKGSVNSIGFASDGSVLASAGDDKIVQLWDVKTGKRLRSLLGHTESVSSIAFAPQGGTLVSGSLDLTARVWDVSNGSELACLKHCGPVLSVAFAPNGKSFATGTGGDFSAFGSDAKLSDVNKALSAPGEAFVWDSAARVARFRHQVSKGQLRSIAFSPDSRMLAIGTTIWNKDYSPWLPQKTQPGDVSLWEPQTNHVELSRVKHIEGVTCIRFSDNGRWLASASTDGFVRIQDFLGIIENWRQK